MYWAFAVVVASVVSRSAPLPAGAVGSTTKFTSPPGRVSAVDQPSWWFGVTTVCPGGAAIATTGTSNAAAKPAPTAAIARPILMRPSSHSVVLCRMAGGTLGAGADQRQWPRRHRAAEDFLDRKSGQPWVW